MYVELSWGEREEEEEGGEDEDGDEDEKGWWPCRISVKDVVVRARLLVNDRSQMREWMWKVTKSQPS